MLNYTKITYNFLSQNLIKRYSPPNVEPQNALALKHQVMYADRLRQQMAFNAKVALRVRHQRRLHRFKSFKQIANLSNIWKINIYNELRMLR